MKRMYENRHDINFTSILETCIINLKPVQLMAHVSIWNTWKALNKNNAINIKQYREAKQVNEREG